MTSIRKQRRALPLLAGFALLATACADLSGIQRFAATSARSAEYTQLIEVYVTSAAHVARYAPEDRRTVLAEQKKLREAQRERLLALHLAVEEYMRALARLASDEVVDYDAQYDALGKAAQNANFADDAEAKAVKKVGGVLTRAVADGYRQKKLREIIGDANEPLQVILGRLRAIAASIADETENLEKKAHQYYQTAIRESRQAGTEALLAGWQYRDEQEIAGLRRSAETYGDALRAISEGHQALYDNRDELDTAEIRRQLTRHARDMRSAIDALRGA